MIDKTIKNIKKYFNTWKGILTAKIYIWKKNTLQGFGGNTYSKNINKKTLQGFEGNTYSKNSKYKKKYFFCLSYV